MTRAEAQVAITNNKSIVHTSYVPGKYVHLHKTKGVLIIYNDTIIYSTNNLVCEPKRGTSNCNKIG